VYLISSFTFFGEQAWNVTIFDTYANEITWYGITNITGNDSIITEVTYNGKYLTVSYNYSQNANSIIGIVTQQKSTTQLELRLQY
jgi:hypothetical protein